MVRSICLYPFNTIVISFNGKVLPCNLDWFEEMVIGNLNQDSLSQIFDGKLAKNFRLSHISGNFQSVCNHCGGSSGRVYEKDVQEFLEDLSSFDNLTQYKNSFLIIIEPSLICTCECKHCLRSNYPDKFPSLINSKPHKYLMSKELMEKSLIGIKDLLNLKKRKAEIMLHWRGEAFLNRLLGWFTRELISITDIPRIILDTNLCVLDEEGIKDFLSEIKKRINERDDFDFRLSFSIDAINKESYDNIRVHGDFGKVKINALAFLQQRSLKKIKNLRYSFQFIAQPYNWHDTQKFIDFWETKIDKNIDDIYIKRCHGEWEFTHLEPKVYSKTLEKFNLVEQAKRKKYLTLDLDENRYFNQKDNGVFKYED